MVTQCEQWQMLCWKTKFLSYVTSNTKCIFALLSNSWAAYWSARPVWKQWLQIQPSLACSSIISDSVIAVWELFDFSVHSSVSLLRLLSKLSRPCVSYNSLTDMINTESCKTKCKNIYGLNKGNFWQNSATADLGVRLDRRKWYRICLAFV